MTVFAVCGLNGAPGVTTLALGLAASIRGAVLVEADPDGGVLAARLGVPARPGLAELAAAARVGLTPDALDTAAVPCGYVDLVPAEPSLTTVAAVLAGGADGLATALAALARPVVVDAGRLRSGSPAEPLLRRATRVVVVARSAVEHAARLRAVPCAPGWGVVTSGLGEHRPVELADAAGWPLLAALPHDGRGAAAVGRARPSGARRSPLVRAVADLAAELVPALADGPGAWCSPIGAAR